MTELLFMDGNVCFYDLDNTTIDGSRISFCVADTNANTRLMDYREVPLMLRHMRLQILLYIKTKDNLIVPFKIIQKTKEFSHLSGWEYKYVILVYGVVRKGYSSKTYGISYPNHITISLSSTNTVCKSLSINYLEFIIGRVDKEHAMYGNVDNIKEAIKELSEVLEKDVVKLHHFIYIQNLIHQSRAMVG